MNSSSHGPGTVVSLGRYGWVCLVLATLLLFNPFFATPRSGHSLEVCRQACHRATVGACEMQHFSPADGWDHQPAVNCVEAAIVLPLPVLEVRLFLPVPSVSLSSPQFFGPGLWFRPPPVR